MTEIPGDFLWGAVCPDLTVGDPALHRDLAQLSALGLRAWRLPIIWSAVQPEGRGAPERAVLDYYQRLIDASCEREIASCVVLSGGPLPGRLARAGGWHHRDTAGRFADHADMMFRALGDRVSRWITHADPRRVAWPEHGGPGQPLVPGPGALRAGLPAAHHLLLGHGRAVEACRAELAAGRIGLALHLAPIAPFHDEEEHLPAVRLADALWNGWFFEPVRRGTYPQAALERAAGRAIEATGLLRFCRDGDLATIAAPIDFLAVGYEGRLLAAADRGAGFDLTRAPGDRAGTVRGLVELVSRLAAEPDPLPVLLETTAAPAAGATGDAARVELLHAELEALAGAIAGGARVEGLLLRTLTDPPGAAATATATATAATAAATGPGAAAGAEPTPPPPPPGLLDIDAATGERTPRPVARYLERIIRDGLAATEPRP